MWGAHLPSQGAPNARILQGYGPRAERDRDCGIWSPGEERVLNPEEDILPEAPGKVRGQKAPNKEARAGTAVQRDMWQAGRPVSWTAAPWGLPRIVSAPGLVRAGGRPTLVLVLLGVVFVILYGQA